MPRSMVGLLAAVAATMAVLASLAHGYLCLLVAIVAAAAGLVGYVTAPDHRSSLSLPPLGCKKNACNLHGQDIGHLTDAVWETVH